MRRGPANGSTHVANIKNRNSHPDNANQRKKIVAKLLPKGVSRKSLSCFLYLGQFLLKSRLTVRHRRPISNSRSTSRAQSPADPTASENRRETAYCRSMRSAVFFASKMSSSKPSLALRQASLQASPEAMRFAKPSKSLRRKARTGIGKRWRTGAAKGRRVWGLEENNGCHGRLVAMTATEMCDRLVARGNEEKGF